MGRNSFDNKDRKTPWGKIILFILILFAIICVIYYFISKDGNIIENSLLKYSKEYYSSGDVLLPESAGECSIVTLATLESNGYVTNEKAFKDCSKNETYVKTCKLEGETYHYTPIYSCEKNKTTFGDWKVGVDRDLTIDKSNVRFSFLPQEYSTKDKNYYPNNSNESSKIKEYYVSAPNNQYTYKDSSVQASKWYTEETGTTYWNNGAYSSTQPNGFANKGNEKTVSYVSLTKPAITSYRTINQITLYRTKETVRAHEYGYICTTYDTSLGIVISNVPCDKRPAEDDYKLMLSDGMIYTCDGKTTAAKDTICESKVTSDWSQNKCTSSGNVICETSVGYQYIDKQWQWYNSGTYRRYYPSGATTSAGENTYYVSAPISGAIQDASTTTTAYKFYKLVDDKASTGKWLNLSDDYLDEEELISLFRKNNYEVDSLKDILDNENINYSIKLEYANRE